jgi:hypothetical protein
VVLEGPVQEKGLEAVATQLPSGELAIAATAHVCATDGTGGVLCTDFGLGDCPSLQDVREACCDDNLPGVRCRCGIGPPDPSLAEAFRWVARQDLHGRLPLLAAQALARIPGSQAEPEVRRLLAGRNEFLYIPLDIPTLGLQSSVLHDPAASEELRLHLRGSTCDRVEVGLLCIPELATAVEKALRGRDSESLDLVAQACAPNPGATP